MKTGEEKFDDEIRHKIRHSEVTPPAGFFNEIVPPENKRRGFFWLWIGGIVLLGITVSLVRFENMGNKTIPPNKQDGQTGTTKRSANPFPTSAVTPPTIKSSNPASSSPISTSNKVEASQNNPSRESGNSVNYANRNSYRSHDNNLNANQNNSRNSAGSGIKQSDDPFKNTNYFKREKIAQQVQYNYDLLFTPAPSLPYTSSATIHPQLKIMKPDKTEFDPHTPTPYGIEVIASMLMGYSSITSATSDTMAIRILNSLSDSDFESKGFEVGAKFLYAINNKFTISAGLEYSQRKQNFNFDFQEFYDELNVDTIKYYILFPFSPPLLVTEYDSSIAHLSRMHAIKHDVIFKTASVSFDVRYNIPAGSFLIEPLAGIAMDVYSTVDGTTNFNTQFEERKGEDHFDSNFQARVKGGLKLGYVLNEKYNVFVQSEYQYGLTSTDTKEAFYSEKTNLLSLGAGIRYTIFKSQATKPQ